MTVVRYEVVFDCRDRADGERLASQLEEVAPVRTQRGEDGPTSWSVVLDFPGSTEADDFFHSDRYRDFCADVRGACQASVLLVPLGPVEA